MLGAMNITINTQAIMALLTYLATGLTTLRAEKMKIRT
jgi:hypothetical protein